MTTPPEDPSSPDREPGGWASPAPAEPVHSDPASLNPPEAPFDPYRYGAPEQPVPPEYAPPGYTPPPSFSKPPTSSPPPAYTQAAPGYGGQPGYGAQPGYSYPGGQQPYPSPPHYAQQYPQPKTGNGKAVAGLVLGILAIVFCWISLFDIVFIVLGIIFGLLGMGEAKRSGTGGRGMAVAGLVCALVGALFATLFTVFVYSKIAPCVNKYDPGPARDHCINQKFGR